MKKREFMNEVKDKSAADLLAQARSIADELMKLRFRKAAGQLEQTHQMKLLRKNLARVRTLAAQKSQATGS